MHVKQETVRNRYHTNKRWRGGGGSSNIILIFDIKENE